MQRAASSTEDMVIKPKPRERADWADVILMDDAMAGRRRDSRVDRRL